MDHSQTKSSHFDHLESGQATVELSLTTALMTLTIIGATAMLKLSWDKHRCARLVFEKTRSELEYIHEKEWGIESELNCGQGLWFRFTQNTNTHNVEKIAFRQIGK